MDWLEDELKQALGRKEPSPDFEARVTDLTGMTAAGRGSVFDRLVLMSRLVVMPRWAVAAAAALVILGASEGYRYRQEQAARGQAAKEQVMLAMRITGTKLNRIQAQMKGVRP